MAGDVSSCNSQVLTRRRWGVRWITTNLSDGAKAGPIRTTWPLPAGVGEPWTQTGAARSNWDSSYGGSAYVNAKIRLEFGARGELWPAEQGYVTSYAAEEFPALFTDPTTPVWVLRPRRTFWEKATILHAIASSGRIGGGERQSRHYADLARLANAPVGSEAIDDIELLLDVAENKATYSPAPKARYELAKPGTLRLAPPNKLLAELENDYVENEGNVYRHTGNICEDSRRHNDARATN